MSGKMLDVYLRYRPKPEAIAELKETLQMTV